MKISKLFHWLYFIVMMLPIFSIPIFSIYSHRHQINDYSVQVEETKVVDFNQYLLPNELSVVNSGVTSYYKDYHLTVSGTSDNYFSRSNRLINSNLLTTEGHKYFFNFHGRNTTNLDIFVNYNYTSNYYSSSIPFIFTASITSDIETYVGINVLNEQVVDIDGYFALYDLTQMFGAGNEPSIQEFNTWYPNNFYDYTLSDKQLLKTGNYITYNDTDIGSQFTYQVYNVVDQYFNYDNVFNFGSLYDWLNLNFFNGAASIGFFIFWHLLIYWLLTSLLWLLFDVLLYVPNLVHRWLDKASIS